MLVKSTTLLLKVVCSFEIWRGDLKSMAKSDHQDQGELRFKSDVSAHVLLVFRPLASGL